MLSTEALDKYLLLKSMTRCQELAALNLWSQKRPGVTVRNGLHSRRTLLPHGCLWEPSLWWGAQGLPRSVQEDRAEPHQANRGRLSSTAPLGRESLRKGPLQPRPARQPPHGHGCLLSAPGLGHALPCSDRAVGRAQEYPEGRTPEPRRASSACRWRRAPDTVTSAPAAPGCPSKLPWL